MNKKVLDEDAEVEWGILPEEFHLKKEEVKYMWDTFHPKNPTNVNPFNPKTFVKRKTVQFSDPISITYHYGGSQSYCHPQEGKENENECGKVPVFSMDKLPPKIANLKNHIEEKEGIAFNQILANFYPSVPIAKHSDNLGPQYEWNEKKKKFYLKKKPNTGNFSFNSTVWGATYGPDMEGWFLDFFEKDDDKRILSIPTPNNSFQIQRGKTLQTKFQHEVNPSVHKSTGNRLNLTFRSVNGRATRKFAEGIESFRGTKYHHDYFTERLPLEKQRKHIKKACNVLSSRSKW